MFVGYYNSPIGIIEIIATDNAVISIDFINIKEKHENLNDLIIIVQKELTEYFNKKRKRFSFAFELKGTEFQKKIWKYLLNIPYGKTLSYKEVAKAIGNEKGVRAVANAIGANKLVVFIPCHRVIGSDGSLTGFTGGIDKKEYLLSLEGISVKGNIIAK